MPLGVILGILKLANEGARDIDNKYRFPNAIIDRGSCFSIDTTIGKGSHIFSGALLIHSHIGSYTYCKNTLVQNATIGNYCSIAIDVIIGLGNHPTDKFSTSPIFYRRINSLKIKILDKDLDFDEYKPIIIGSDVWIGARAIIMDGVNIGHGAIIAAGAIVTKDVPAYAIVGGVPAKIIKYRFSKKTIAKLLQSKWWEKDAKEVFTLNKELNAKLQY